MGFFARIAAEARQGGNQAPAAPQPAISTPPIAPAAEPAPPAAAPETPAARPVPAPDPETAPVTTVAESEAVSVTAEAKPEPSAPPTPAPGKLPEPPVVDLTPDADAADEAERKRVHEEAEAKRKAEWEDKQAAKKKARQEQLDRIKAMNDAELLAESVKRVAADTEKLTRRNMKEAVCEHIQAKCRQDPAFARLVMSPEKSMINCFKFIYRKAREYAEQEMKDLGIERTGTYGTDVPDGLCYSWSESYFQDTNVKEDRENEEKFVPKPYISQRKAAKSKTAAKKMPDKKKPAAEKPKGAALEQMSLI